jgi:hypothetical protein
MLRDDEYHDKLSFATIRCQVLRWATERRAHMQLAIRVCLSCVAPEFSAEMGANLVESKRNSTFSV